MKKTLRADYLCVVLGWEFTDEEKKTISAEFNSLAEVLETIQDRHRRTLLSFVEHSESGRIWIDEIASYDSYKGRAIAEDMKTLERKFLISFDGPDGEGGQIISLGGDGKFCDIKKFCDLAKIPLEKIILDLNFELFDKKMESCNDVIFRRENNE
jgi:hypothetical protein